MTVIPGFPSKFLKRASYSLQVIAGKIIKKIKIKLDVSIDTIFVKQLPVVVILLAVSFLL